MSKKIRWGMIGCGDVTEKKSGPGFQKANNSELVAVMSRTRDKAKDYASRHRVPKWYDDADRLINDPEVDAVYIATPPDSHKYYTIKTAAAKKPVYVEKPMARSYEECQEMIRSCKKYQVPLFCAYYRRSLPKFLKVKELLDSEVIGKPGSVWIFLSQMPQADQYEKDSLPWRVIPKISGGGYFFDLASHTLDLLDFYFGPISSVCGHAQNQMDVYPAEDIISSSFIFENGTVGGGLWCFTTTMKEDLVKIIGQNGKIVFSTFSSDPITIHLENSQETITIDHPVHVQQPHIQSIVNEILGVGKCPSHGETAARTCWVMDQILNSWRKSNGIQFD